MAPWEPQADEPSAKQRDATRSHQEPCAVETRAQTRAYERLEDMNDCKNRTHESMTFSQVESCTKKELMNEPFISSFFCWRNRSHPQRTRRAARHFARHRGRNARRYHFAGRRGRNAIKHWRRPGQAVGNSPTSAPAKSPCWPRSSHRGPPWRPSSTGPSC